MQKKVKILFLSQWYPTENDRMMGLFVQRHAQAVAAQGAEVRVNSWWPEADVVQLNVLTLKMGMVAYVLWRVFGIPYVIVEHWSGYLPMNGDYERFPRWKRRLLEQIALEAKGIYPVSEMLKEHMERCGIRNAHWGKVENVVEDIFDAQCTVHNARFEFLHVSCFDERAKNVKSLLRATKMLGETRQDFRLTLVGTGADWAICRAYANELGIADERLRWTGELSPEEVCKTMQQSDCLILASRWETYGVPLAEAMATGVPCIRTTTCGLQVDEECGLSIAPDDDEALADAMTYMLDHHGDYDRAAISRKGERFSYEAVGQQLMEIYEDAKARK